MINVCVCVVVGWVILLEHRCRKYLADGSGHCGSVDIFNCSVGVQFNFSNYSFLSFLKERKIRAELRESFGFGVG